MTSNELLNQVRQSLKFKTMCEKFKRMTELNLWLDSLEADDPRSTDEIASDYYSIMLKDDTLKDRCESSHQTMRDSAHNKTVKYADGISGLIHFLVPIHAAGQEIGFLRCGGVRDSYRGVLKFMNFSQELREEGFEEEMITELAAAFQKLPNLHGEDLAEAVDWLAARAAEIDKAIERLVEIHG